MDKIWEEKVNTNNVGKHIRAIQEAFKKKKELEVTICNMIRDFEEQTGLAIDVIKYQRDITLPMRGPRYTDLTIVITSDAQGD